MRITFVKKILASGEPCRKCREVEQRLEDAGHMAAIDRVLIADERDHDSEGMILSQKLNVDLAPFFVVEDGDETRVYTVYFKFVKEELDNQVRTTDQDSEDILRSNPDLDFI